MLNVEDVQQDKTQEESRSQVLQELRWNDKSLNLSPSCAKNQ